MTQTHKLAAEPGLHDDRCATRKGYPCNCASAAFTRTAPAAGLEPRGCPTPGACSCVPAAGVAPGPLIEMAKQELATFGRCSQSVCKRLIDALASSTAEIAELRAKLDAYQARVIPAETRIVELEHRLLELGQTI